MMRSICTFLFKASGWTFKSDLPKDLRSFIFLGAPHTSNHDFVPAMAVATLMNRNTRFIIKDDWVKFPFGLIMRPAGAIGLDRKKLTEAGHASNTDLMAQLFKDYKELVLMIAPEGTRKATDAWKTGFYYIAQKAKVPIVLGYADFPKKIAGTGPVIYPTDFEKDMKQIMDFYRNITGKVPGNFKLDARYQ
ncbi:1-acyl-sn-glycerol-3-phosphate acyltransferase [Peredibacter sp. HCB2-198]|uniref:1-acyl-sn-glycerol-3-phosphate acyltransferase n=1 Tax=Peredibacter sp. HCB2-198 TaxID=3383025 RepID=UPI0038B66048